MRDNKWTVSEIKAYLKDLKDPGDPLIEIWQADPRKGVQAALASFQKEIDQHRLLVQERDEKLRLEKHLWSQGLVHVVGVDEVGRGPLAGPVVSAAVILPPDTQLLGINDSKQISKSKRDILFDQIMNQALAVGLGVVDAETIDRLNILEAARLSMELAVKDLKIEPDYILADAMTLSLNVPQKSLIKGDSQSLSIAAASIIAKVSRDRLMEDYAKVYPEFGFDRHAGYGTKDHLQALANYGPCPIHRRSFKPVQKYL